MRRVAAVGFAIWLLSLRPVGAQDLRWVCYYSDKAPVAALSRFDLLVLDSDYHPELRALSDRGKTVIGYLSVGEVERTRAHFAEVYAEGILLHENRNWEGSFFVDVRDARWVKRVVERLVPAILRRGFDGIFLDTVDNAAHLERQDPHRYKGMSDAMVHLIKTIRRHYPRIKVIMNRGFELLPQVERDIDMILGESIFADYDFGSKTYKLTAPEEYRRQARILTESRRRRPELTILTLDYWEPSDRAGIARIYREQRANGFNPYVADVGLDRIIEEPRP